MRTPFRSRSAVPPLIGWAAPPLLPVEYAIPSRTLGERFACNGALPTGSSLALPVTLSSGTGEGVQRVFAYGSL